MGAACKERVYTEQSKQAMKDFFLLFARWGEAS